MTKVLTKTEAAAYLGCSVPTFDLHVRPHIANISEHSHPRFRSEDVEAWIMAQRVPPKAAHG